MKIAVVVRWGEGVRSEEDKEETLNLRSARRTLLRPVQQWSVENTTSPSFITSSFNLNLCGELFCTNYDLMMSIFNKCRKSYIAKIYQDGLLLGLLDERFFFPQRIFSQIHFPRRHYSFPFFGYHRKKIDVSILVICQQVCLANFLSPCSWIRVHSDTLGA